MLVKAIINQAMPNVPDPATGLSQPQDQFDITAVEVIPVFVSSQTVINAFLQE
jgi:hypothetical protein